MSNSEAEMNDRPNILFIMADDHAVQAISALNRGRVQLNETPNLDRIADEGAVLQGGIGWIGVGPIQVVAYESVSLHANVLSRLSALVSRSKLVV